VHLVGVRLPAADLGVVGARIDLTRGITDLALSRTGEQLRGHWSIGTDSAVWSRLEGGATADTGSATRIGSQAWVNTLVWRTVSSLRHVEVDAAITGTLSSPQLDVSSNVGGEVSRSLQQALKGEVARAEAQVRARVDSLVAQQVAAARAKLAALDTDPLKSLTDDRAQLDAVQAQLEQRLKGLVPGIPGLR
jgi:hypothetical protein